MIKELMHAPIFLAVLGKMYVADERFKKNIDKYGNGTAELASRESPYFAKRISASINLSYVNH